MGSQLVCSILNKFEGMPILTFDKTLPSLIKLPFILKKALEDKRIKHC